MSKDDNIDYRLIDEPHLMMSPTLADKFYDSEALFIQQVHYWLIKSGKEINGQKWIYNTFEDWQKQFPFWSISKIKRIVKNLKNNNVLIIDNFNKHKWDRTLWYSLNYNTFEAIVSIPYYGKYHLDTMTGIDMTLSHSFNMTPPIPVNYTETKTAKKFIIKDHFSVIKHLNEKTGKNYKAGPTGLYYKILIENEFKHEDFFTVIDKQCNAWLGTKYESGLHPEKLFGDKERFDKYLNLTPYNDNTNPDGNYDDAESYE